MSINHTTWRVLACIIVGFSAGPLCAQNGQSVHSALAVPNTANAAAEVATYPLPPAYRMQPHDTVHIRVFHEDDLETTARIDRDGNIAFPLLGTARIGGKTVQEATAAMEGLLRTYLVHPQVSLEIVSYARQRFTIIGQVGKPGTIDMPDETQIDLLEAIGMAGGYTKEANPGKITIKRIVDGKEEIIKLDAKRMLKDPNVAPFQILPGDTIQVGEAFF